ADRNRSHWSTSKTPSYTKSVSWQHHQQLLLTEITPWTFSDDIRTKTYADGRKEEIYMIYLIFDCVSANREVKINEEFQDYAWVKPEDLVHYDLNVATRKTLRLKGLL
ncbi:nucleoside triphosphatase NudI, partial [Escherichia sp. Ec20190506]|uniref:nucleoside triphosphatase NudI n=1 Tax=Escherichia sp. Ec20190506 TaxID=3108169 RepID=UPI002B6714DD